MEEPAFKPIPVLVRSVFWRERNGALLRPKQAEAKYGRALYRGASRLPICARDCPVLVVDNTYTREVVP
ncbi:MAG TPA: hypothetical protein VLV50_16235 [Stellaceae bacterium]|nr:hypothetical protein [Stellaceae bacterium]